MSNLLNKVKDVINENEILTDQAKSGLPRSMFQDSSESDATTEIDAATFKSRANTKIPLHGPNIVFESRISELEAQLAQAAIDFKKLSNENDENKRKIAMGLGDAASSDIYKKQFENLQR